MILGCFFSNQGVERFEVRRHGPICTGFDGMTQWLGKRFQFRRRRWLQRSQGVGEIGRWTHLWQTVMKLVVVNRFYNATESVRIGVHAEAST